MIIVQFYAHMIPRAKAKLKLELAVHELTLSRRCTSQSYNVELLAELVQVRG